MIFFIRRYIHSAKSESHLNEMLGYKRHSLKFQFDAQKLNVLDVVQLCRRSPNICRILFDFLLSTQNRDSFHTWCNSDELLGVNVAKLLRFLKLKTQSALKTAEVFLLISTHLGFSNLFSQIVSENAASVYMRDIQIRECNSFTSLLHLLMYHSQDDDKTTIEEKMLIINVLLEKDSSMIHARDYFGNTPILERNVSFDLVRYLAGKGARLEDMDFMRSDLLEKSKDNTAFTAKLMWEFPEIYDRLNLRFRARLKPPFLKPVGNAVGTCRVTIDDIKTFLSKGHQKNDLDLSLERVAMYT